MTMYAPMKAQPAAATFDGHSAGRLQRNFKETDRTKAISAPGKKFASVTVSVLKIVRKRVGYLLIQVKRWKS